ncbi:MAG: CPBP family glutamic-type intramembrane protease [Candidatus Auribacterota bacterium]
MAVKRYLRYTHHPYYGFLLSIPLIIIYEAGIIYLHKYSSLTVRNLFDVVTKKMIVWVGGLGFFMLSVALLLGVIFLLRPKKDMLLFHGWYFIAMIMEATAYAMFYLGAMTHLGQYAMSSATDYTSGFSGVILSFGAGIYEELMFRVVVFGLLMLIMHRIFGLRRFISFLFAASVSSVFFSLVHYWGNAADTFTAYTFWFRFAGGMFFSIIYFFRGFAASVYTHALYDVLIALAVSV